jgi:hypothetical protein
VLGRFRPVDPDDFGAHVAEQHGGMRHRADAAKFHHADPGEDRGTEA